MGGLKRGVWLGGAALIVVVAVAGFLLPPQPGASVPFAIGPAIGEGRVKPRLTSHGDAALLLAPDGSLWGWGGTQSGLESVMPSPGRSDTPRRVDKSRDWAQVALGGDHVVALKINGTLWGWGRNVSGELGVTKPSRVKDPLLTDEGTNWIQVAAGACHSLGLQRDGSLWAWGDNRYGQIGNGSKAQEVFTPERVGTNDWKEMSCGAFNSFGLKTNGTVWAWGSDLAGGGGQNQHLPQQLGQETNWATISAGEFHLLALKNDGTLWVCGQNGHIVIGDQNLSLSNSFHQVGTNADWVWMESGENNFVARRRDGTLCVSARSQGRSLQPLPFQTDPWVMEMGNETVILLGKDGTLWSTGARLGTVATPSFGERIFRLVRNLQAIFSKGGVFVTRSPTQDEAAYKIWDLPSEVRESMKPVPASEQP